MATAGTTPHDAVFKQFLMHPDAARDFLDIHLPAEIRAICDLTTLRLESGNFVEENLREHYSDILYSVKMQGEPGYLHVLIEHQSTPSKKITFRMVRYAIAAMHRHLEAGFEKLPLVVPILFYQGKASPYPYSMRWLDLFASPELAKRLYSEPFPLVDITVIPDDQIMQHRRVAVLELLQKHIRQRDLMQMLEDLVTLLNTEYTTENQLITLVNYMLLLGHTDQETLFFRELAKRLSKEKKLGSLGQWFEDQGMEKGIQKGIQEGEDAARQRVALRMLKNGMSVELVAEMTELPPEAIAKMADER
ncbi:Rpn family recombination-promoting nuclease/putative transposase [Pseudocitrobacter cyperus]|uniref:Rpn family recombination-promoting nuclease/putative transposase n=1 Tax=Pseudocitrobacter cyperus TaxID=3112843 RepID=A0ABV0HI87_9ENTR